MCWFVPCIRWIQRHLDPDDEVLCSVVVTEIFRWFAIVIPIYLSVWRYATVSGYTIFIANVNEAAQFWGVVSAIFVVASIVVYLPIKILSVIYLGNVRKRYGWRPSIVTYIFCCALPCLIMVAIATIREIPRAEVMTPFNTMVLQVTVMGLTVTEWMAKMKEEVMTYDLISAMATDFFFAYDAIDFFMLAAVDKEVYGSGWVYVTFVTGFVAMFKYVPTQPATIKEYGAPKGAVTCILVGMICNDIPFVVVRLMTLTEFGLQISDLIHPAKNIAMILFGITQLYIIFYNTRASRRAVDKVKYEERRCLRRPTLKPADWAAGSVLKNTAGGAIGGWDCDATRF